MGSGVLKCKCGPLWASGHISAAMMEWAVLCQINYVQGPSSLGFPRFFFFFSWQFTCAQSSVSWSPADTCMPPAVSPPENVTQGMLPVTFFIILQINFPWLLEWELKSVGGSFKTDLPHIFTDEPWGKSAFPNCFQIDEVAPYGDLGFLLAQLVFSLSWSNCHFDHSKQDKASLRLV